MSLIRKGHGGIQLGGTSITEASATLDTQLKELAKKLAKEFKGFNKGHSKNTPLFEGVYSGCVPDGGLWLDGKGKVRVAIEGKVQGNHGNAQERHAKNLLICHANRSELGFRYVTFMAGEGAISNGVLDQYAKTILQCMNPEGQRSTNVIHPNGVSFFLNPLGWSKDSIEKLMREALQ